MGGDNERHLQTQGVSNWQTQEINRALLPCQWFVVLMVHLKLTVRNCDFRPWAPLTFPVRGMSSSIRAVYGALERGSLFLHFLERRQFFTWNIFCKGFCGFFSFIFPFSSLVIVQNLAVYSLKSHARKKVNL